MIRDRHRLLPPRTNKQREFWSNSSQGTSLSKHEEWGQSQPRSTRSHCFLPSWFNAAHFRIYLFAFVLSCVPCLLFPSWRQQDYVCRVYIPFCYVDSLSFWLCIPFDRCALEQAGLHIWGYRENSWWEHGRRTVGTQWATRHAVRVDLYTLRPESHYYYCIHVYTHTQSQLRLAHKSLTM